MVFYQRNICIIRPIGPTVTQQRVTLSAVSIIISSLQEHRIFCIIGPTWVAIN